MCESGLLGHSQIPAERSILNEAIVGEQRDKADGKLRRHFIASLSLATLRL